MTIRTILKWTVAAAVVATTSTAMAQSRIRSGGGDYLVDSYTAYIGDNDLYNSDGGRLTQPWQIIRQDRANYYRFGLRDRGDQGDSFFNNARNRDSMERMLRYGRISPRAARQIVRGGTYIQVEIYGRGSTGNYVVVTTQ